MLPSHHITSGLGETVGDPGLGLGLCVGVMLRRKIPLSNPAAAAQYPTLVRAPVPTTLTLGAETLTGRGAVWGGNRQFAELCSVASVTPSQDPTGPAAGADPRF